MVKTCFAGLCVLVALAGCADIEGPETDYIGDLDNAAEIEAASNAVIIDGRTITMTDTCVFFKYDSAGSPYAGSFGSSAPEDARGPINAKAVLTAAGPAPFPSNILFIEMYAIKTTKNLVWIDRPSIRYNAGAVNCARARIQEGPEWKREKPVDLVLRLMNADTGEEYYVRGSATVGLWDLIE